MPKRRSLVGTAREAMGDSRKVQAEKPAAAAASAKVAPKKHRRAAPKPRSEPTREAPAAAFAPEPMALEAAPETMPSTPSAYEAMLGFANAVLRQNLETGVRLARCTSPQEVVAAQMAHATALAQSFVAASLKLMQGGLPGAPWAQWRARPDSQ